MKPSNTRLKKVQGLWESLSLRLTLWYAVIFSMSAFLLLYVFYHRVATVTMGRTDQELLEEFNEFDEIVKAEGLEKVKSALAEKEKEEAGQGVFFRLLAADGNILVDTGMQAIGRIEFPNRTVGKLDPSNSCYLETTELPDYGHRFRILYGFLEPEAILQVGMSLEDNEAYLEIFSSLILYAVTPIVVLAALIGWLMARKALGGVAEVTQTAMVVSTGSYERRVKVKKRSAEIDRLADAFNQMLDRLQTLIKTIRDMNDNIAHELRSPLARMRGIAEMTLFDKNAEGNYEEMAASIIEDCDHLIDMVNSMFEITEAEAGIVDMQFERFDLNDMIADVCELFRPVAEEKAVQIIQKLPQNSWIKGDRKKLQRVFANLLENAIKYTSKGGQVAILVEVSRHRYVIRVDDTGSGISEKDLPYIFNRFYRGDKSRSQEGLGLGLSLVKAIVESLKGDIEVTSIPNIGSTFKVIIPL